MDRLAVGDVIEEVYRVDAVLSETPRAHVYGVTHTRFPDVKLALKVAAPKLALDFDRDTSALGSLGGPCFVRVVDRGQLPDGRMYRVMERLGGPSLRAALATGPFAEQRAMDILVALAAAVHEAHTAGIGPCDLSLDNLMFADGKESTLCLVRAIVPFASGPSEAADRKALSALRFALLKEDLTATRLGAHEPHAAAWKPPSSIEEIRAAIAHQSGRYTPATSTPGSRIGRWEVIRRLSETLHATVYDVVGPNKQQGVLKIAGPETDHAAFTKQADLLARIQSRNVVRVVDFGTHDNTPFMVMDPLHMTLTTRLEQHAPLAIDAALQTVDELLWGAEAVSKFGGAPSDFSLEHCYQATREPSPSVLTRGLVQTRSFGLHGRPSQPDQADAWSATVALYELLAARLPFPTSKHSLAKAWMGMPIPLASRRRDVPYEISDLVHAILMGKRVTTAELRRELTRIRSAPAVRRSSPPERVSVTPPDRSGSSVPPPPARVLARTEQDLVPLRAMVEEAIAASPIIEVPAKEPDAPREGMRQSIEPPAPAPARDVPTGSPDWKLVLGESTCPIGGLTCAAFDGGGSELVVVAPDAVARFRAGHWTVDPARIAPATVLALVPMGDGYLALTSNGPLLRLGQTGGFSPWGVALDKYVFHAAVPPGPRDEGFPLVGTTRDRKRGVVARLVGESLTVLSDALEVAPLRAATQLPDGALLAATEDGTIVVVRQARIAEGIRPAKTTFLATAVVGDEVVVVGAGAWAFRVTTAPLTATLEPVDTLSALSCIAVVGDQAWAGTDRGRILLRREHHWRRMSPSFENDPAVLAIHATPDRMRAVLADGRIVVGSQG